MSGGGEVGCHNNSNLPTKKPIILVSAKQPDIGWFKQGQYYHQWGGELGSRKISLDLNLLGFQNAKYSFCVCVCF